VVYCLKSKVKSRQGIKGQRSNCEIVPKSTVEKSKIHKAESKKQTNIKQRRNATVAANFVTSSNLSKVKSQSSTVGKAAKRFAKVAKRKTSNVE